MTSEEMIITVRMDTNNKITMPKDLRDELEMESGDFITICILRMVKKNGDFIDFKRVDEKIMKEINPLEKSLKKES